MKVSCSMQMGFRSFIFFPFCPFSEGIPLEIAQQYHDNLRWLDEADKHKMVVGSQARILYSDQQGRVAIAEAFNEAVSSGEVSVRSQLLINLGPLEMSQ